MSMCITDEKHVLIGYIFVKWTFMKKEKVAT